MSDGTDRVRAVAEEVLRRDPGAGIVFTDALDASSYQLGSDGTHTTLYLNGIYEPFVRTSLGWSEHRF